MDGGGAGGPTTSALPPAVPAVGVRVKGRGEISKLKVI